MKFQYSPHLPITSARHKILELIENNPVVVLVGETGSGKTTQTAQYIAEQQLIARKKKVSLALKSL